MRLAFGLVFAIILSTVVITVFIIDKFNKSKEWVSQTHQTVVKLNSAQSQFNQARISTKNFLLSREIRHLALRLAALDNLDDNIITLQFMTSNNPQQKENVEILVASINNYKTITSQAIKDIDNYRLEDFSKVIDSSEPISRDVSIAILNMMQEEERMLIVGDIYSTSIVNQSRSIMPFVLIVDLIITIYIYSLILSNYKDNNLDVKTM